MIHRIAVLTSGGDAPGMNAAIRAVSRAALDAGYQVFGVLEGYKGLVNNEIFQIDRSFVSEIIGRGGTILKTARLKEFEQREVRLQAVRNLKARKIDTVVVIGGNGTLLGGYELSKEGITVIGIPGTIDNDITCSDLTIGFDTALNTIVESVDKLRDTSSSHQRCSIIEVMGRHCGDLALEAGFGTGAEIISSSERPLTTDEIAEKILDLKLSGKKHTIIVVSEKLYKVHELAKDIEERVGVESRATVLGHIQRGGTPSAKDRVLASKMGLRAIESIEQELGSGCIASINSKIVFLPMEEAINMKRDIDLKQYKDAERLK